MTQLLDRLIREHKHLFRVLDLLDDLLDRFHEGEEPDYELMREMVEYMESYADQVHHPSEEDIFDRIRSRSGHRHPVLDQVTAQHRRIARINKHFSRSLQGIMNEEVLLRDQVEMQGRELIKTLREHLDLEERTAFPLAREQLSARDWNELLAAVPKDAEPPFDDARQRHFQSLVRYLSEQNRA